MKSNWQTKKLSDICQIKPPKSEAKKKLADFDMVSFVPMEDLGIGRKELDASRMKPLKEVVSGYTYFAEGDVLLAKITPCFENGKLGIARKLVNGVGFGSSEYVVFRASTGLLNEYLYYFLSRPEFREEGTKRMTGAVGHKRVPNDFIDNIQIPVPPLSEQQRIVTILDQAFEGIATATANAEKNLNSAREIFESELQHVFSRGSKNWVEKSLGELGATLTGSTPPTSDKSNYGNYLPFIKPADFSPDGTLNYGNGGLSEQGAKQARKIPPHSVLMVCIGATIGKCGWCDREISANQQINALAPINGVSHKLIYYQMLTKDFQQRVLQSAGQATLPIINKSKWSGLKVCIPPTFSEQGVIVEGLDELSAETKKLEVIYQQKLAALAELRKSILHQAFSGQLN